MSGMFSNAPNLENINFGPSFTPEKVTYFTNMFLNAKSLKHLDMSSFTIKSPNAAYNILSGTNLESIELGSNLASLQRTGLPEIPEDKYFTGGWQHQQKVFM